MFVCLEIDTEDMEVWSMIDTKMAEVFGLTHVLWGVDESKAPNRCQLPSNLFTADINLPTKDLQKKLVAYIKTIWNGNFIAIVMKGDHWSTDEHKAPKPMKTHISDNVSDIETNRIE